MRKALLIGINDYSVSPLKGCVNDVNELQNVLANNEDTTVNFDIKTLVDNEATADNIKKGIKDLFKNDDEIALLYFSGHGMDTNEDGAIVSQDLKKLNFKSIMDIVFKAKAKYKIVILDCCFSGKAGNDYNIGDTTVLGENTVILTACRPNEPAMDNGIIMHGTFTNLLLCALQGGASDILGRITPGSIYSYIDQALGSWEQRPYFKANVSSFVSLRNVNPKIDIKELKEGLKLFKEDSCQYKLDPSYEYTNARMNRKNRVKIKKPFAIDQNIKLMQIMQKMNQCGLLLPTEEKYIYYAAMNSSSVHLTELGKHYWNLLKKGRF